MLGRFIGSAIGSRVAIGSRKSKDLHRGHRGKAENTEKEGGGGDSDYDGFAVFAEGAAEGVGDFAYCGVGFYGG
jgi:hypothetical protein